MSSSLLPFFLLAFSALTFGAFTHQEYTETFQEWMNQHNKHYEASEYLSRFKIFSQHMDFVEKHNSEGHSFTVGLNQFADLTNDEFLNKYGSVQVPSEQSKVAPASPQALPTSIDWRQKGVVTPVKNQGQNSASWAYAATGAVESAWALNYSLVSLSEQNLVDCVGFSKSVDGSFQYIIKNGGIDTEDGYPASTTPGCKYDPAHKGASITSYKDVFSGSESALQNAVVYSGPVAVYVDASHTSFQLYTSGVYYEPTCSATNLDHAMLVVGYSTDSGKDYWIVKNSWGTSWGQAGYIWMSRNRNNNCGIATAASFPIV